MSGKLLECRTWCISQAKAKLAEDLNLPDADKGDVWINSCINLAMVVSIKESNEDDEFCGPGKAELLFPNGTIVTTDLPYTKVVSKWKEVMDQ